VSPGAALAGGFQRALLAGSIFLVAAALIALRAANTRGEPVSEISAVAVPGAVADTAPDAVGSVLPERRAEL